MGFFKAFERNILRPIGRGAKAVAPIAGTIAGTALGGPLGGAIGNTLGGMAKRGKVDLGKDAVNFGSGLLMSGVAGKLGLGGAAGGAAKTPNLGTLNAKNLIGVTGGKGIAAIPGNAITSGAGDTMGNGLMSSIGNWMKDGKNLKALGDTAIGGYGAVQQEREFQRRRELENEQRTRSQALDPARAQLLAMIMQRMGGAGAQG
jgi:hypothetical protein